MYRILFGVEPEQHHQMLWDLRQKRSLDDFLSHDLLTPPTGIATGLIYKILRDNPQLLFDPEVMDVIGHLTGTTGSPSDLDPKEVADVIKVSCVF